jgi:hypothetical protein
LIHQERDLVSVGQFGVLRDRYTAVMVVIAQRHINRRDGAQAAKKPKQMRQSFWHIEQISCDENPIRVKPLHSGDNLVMSWVISVKVQIREMDGPTTGKKGMCLG